MTGQRFRCRVGGRARNGPTGPWIRLVGPITGSVEGVRVGERLYPLRLGTGWHIECGRCGGRQVLLGFTHIGHCFVLHWFAADGRFLGLERVPVAAAPPPRHPGTTIFRHDPAFERAKAAELAALKERLGFRAGDIAVHRFESDEACIQELSGEYEEYLQSPESFSPEEREALAEDLAAWHRKGYFALAWHEEYWLSQDGQVVAT